MAEASISVVQDQFICPICLDLLNNPVTINCGHNYCMSCITDCWDQTGVNRCPQCRQTFTPRPVLGKNTMLTEVVEKLKKTKLQAARPDHCYAGPGDVECDVCTERKHKAVKSCLVCLNSYCQNHLEQHENLFKRNKHKMIDATGLDGSTDSPNITVSSFDDFCEEEIEKISDGVKYTELVLTPEPKKRKDFLQYFRQFTLDSNTVYKYLRLSDGNKVITKVSTDQLYPDHPDRFDVYPQVLCRESVCGRCYWEVEWSGIGVCISVSYKSISRVGQSDKCTFGYNDQSWSLYCFPTSYSKYSFYHNNKETKLSVVSRSSRIGVYVDHSAGTLSFYSVSDTMTLIHRVQTTFTQPLYPGFRVFETVKLCDLTNE